MNLSDLSATSVTTESDVEQKIILPLLTAAEWLAVPDSAIRTKHYLPPTTIDKGPADAQVISRIIRSG